MLSSCCSHFVVEHCTAPLTFRHTLCYQSTTRRSGSYELLLEVALGIQQTNTN